MFIQAFGSRCPPPWPPTAASVASASMPASGASSLELWASSGRWPPVQRRRPRQHPEAQAHPRRSAVGSLCQLSRVPPFAGAVGRAITMRACVGVFGCVAHGHGGQHQNSTKPRRPSRQHAPDPPIVPNRPPGSPDWPKSLGAPPHETSQGTIPNLARMTSRQTAA